MRSSQENTQGGGCDWRLFTLLAVAKCISLSIPSFVVGRFRAATEQSRVWYVAMPTQQRTSYGSEGPLQDVKINEPIVLTQRCDFSQKHARLVHPPVLLLYVWG